MSDLEQGLRIVVAGIGGVFFNLLVLMVVLVVIGKVFGKKKKKKQPKTQPEKKTETGASEANKPK